MMKQWISVSFLTLFVGLAAACGPTGTNTGDDSCSSDSECKGDRICDDGECVSPGGGGSGGDGNGGGGGGGGGSDNNGGSGGGSDNNGGGGGGGDDAWCCVNGAYHGCATDADAQTCVFDFDPSVCDRDASKDATCDDGGGGGGGNNDNNGGGGGGGGGGDKKATGDTCEVNNECQGGACLVRDDGDILGYCSERCESFADCPTFWDCEELGNAAGRYCVQS